MGRGRDVVAGLGFLIIAALVTSNVMPERLEAARTHSTQIFFTNCKLLLNKPSLWDSEHLPEHCSMIFTLLQASLISVGLLLIIFGATKWVSIFSIVNLIGLSCLYANPFIDASFQTYSLFLMLVVTKTAFLVRIFRDESEEEEARKNHRD